MLSEIQIINSSLCDLEKHFNVIFNRETAVIQEQTGVKVLHLLIQDYVQQTTESGGQIISCVSVIKPGNDVTSFVTILFNEGTTFNAIQLVDVSDNVIVSITPFTSNPDHEEADAAFPGFIQPSINIESITDNGDGTYHVVVSIDITIFWIISIKIATFEFDV